MSANPTTTASATPSFTIRHRSTIAQAALYLGALSVLGTGVVHIQQYYDQDYSTIPTIGMLFFLNFVAAVVIAVGLIAPLGRVTPRYADAIRSVFAIGGIGLGVLSLAALFVSESSGLFGFAENGYRTPIVLAMVAEIAATLFLIVFLVASGVAQTPIRRGRRAQ
jgi:hypothetical protein